MLRSLASCLPASLIARLNNAQYEHPLLGRLLRGLARRVADGEAVVRRGPAAGLRIDASGTNSGYVLGTTEPLEQRWLQQNVAPGDTVYDIGANIGFHTLLVARLVTPRGYVYSFEPLPANVAQLRTNVSLNALAHVAVIPAAVTATDGAAVICDPDGQRVRSRLVPAGSSATEITVESIAIDSWSLREDPKPPMVMKVDVEGSELEVLSGAMETITRWKPTLLVEVHWLGAVFVDFVRTRLEPLGYVATTLNGDEMSPTQTRFHAVVRARGGPSARI